MEWEYIKTTTVFLLLLLELARTPTPASPCMQTSTCHKMRWKPIVRKREVAIMAVLPNGVGEGGVRASSNDGGGLTLWAVFLLNLKDLLWIKFSLVAIFTLSKMCESIVFSKFLSNQGKFFFDFLNSIKKPYYEHMCRFSWNK
jgi:hypothetical protein